MMPKANETPTILIDRLVKKNELRQAFTLMDHRRESSALPSPLIGQPAAVGHDPTFVRQEVRKTTLNGALTMVGSYAGSTEG